MKPRIILKPAFTVVGLSQHIERIDGITEALWEQLSARFHEIPNVDPDIGFGVHTWKDSNRHYLAGMSLRGVSDVQKIPVGMTAQRLEKHAYAVFPHSGLVSNLPETIKGIFSDWLPNSIYQIGDDFFFEYYDDHFQPGSVDSLIFIFVPITPKR